MAVGIDTIVLPNPSKDFPYSEIIQTSGGVGPYIWSLKTGDLPPGLVLDVASVADSTTLAGTPTEFGEFSFTVKVIDSGGGPDEDEQTYTIRVEEAPQLVTFQTRVQDPATGLGVELTALTAEIFNGRGQLQETLIFPAGIVEEFAAPTGFVYKVVNLDITDDLKWHGDFIQVRWSAVVGAVAIDPYFESVVTSSIVIPALGEAREPYCTVLEANEYFNSKLQGKRWRRFDEQENEKLLALVEASDQIDREKFKGYKIRVFEGTTLGRQWPRFLPVEELAGGLFSDLDKIPLQVREACCVQARFLLEQEERGHDMEMRQFLQLSGVTSVNRGVNQESYDISSAQNSELCPEAQRLIQPYLAVTMSDTPGLS